MNSDQIKQLYQLRDRSVRVLSNDGFFRAVCIKNTKTAIEAQTRHKLSFFQSALMARALAASSLLASFLKGEERVIIELEGNGPVKRVYAESLQLGEVRGFVNYDKSYDYNNIANISDLLGLGLLKITKIMYNKKNPVTGLVPLVKGDVSTDLANYFLFSEQIPVVVNLDVSLDDDGMIKQSGGFIIQAMPGYSKDALAELYEKTKNISNLSHYFENRLNPMEVLKEVLPFEFHLIGSTQIDFFCRCSKENFMGKLTTLNVEEIEDLKFKGENELACQYCGNKYHLDDKDFDTIITEMKARKN